MKQSRRYAQLFKTQTLLKEREELQLTQARRELAALEEETRYLFWLMQKGATTDFIDPLLLARRLERTRQAQAAVQAKVDTMIQSLLQATRRCEMIAEKQRAARAQEEHKEMADMMEEFVTRTVL
ncbi:MAG: Hypothetical protein BHV28_02020 [Candidatus Tokpelaia hoelldobleri]|uniref:Flagellar FliJ protein n=1 Tax=Candidatus Tokpelaia hoelldobleri TaxID=1902579 RepID=A0A1U9JSU1_9HYPH|nr:MAG: Hypothetical protein BHV28_02020 [Candidatus Tokpelaia hoelldoblerii]